MRRTDLDEGFLAADRVIGANLFTHAFCSLFQQRKADVMAQNGRIARRGDMAKVIGRDICGALRQQMRACGKARARHDRLQADNNLPVGCNQRGALA